MELTDFVNSVPGFAGISHVEKVKHLGWYLLAHRGMERFTSTDIKQCYEALHLDKPNITDVLNSLTEKKPKEALKDSKGFRLELRVRQEFDVKYGNRPASIPIEKMLAELPGKIPDEAQCKYLSEALDCYRAKAYRGAILMVWNLAYDHLVNWVLADAGRITAFNTRLPNKEPFKNGFVITKREDFEELKESETVGICAKLNLITDNQKKVLEEKLNRRNMYSHPSSLEVSVYRVDDAICDLVNNIVLKLV